MAPLFGLAALLAAVPLAAQDGTPRAEPATSLRGGEVYEWTSSAGAPYWYRMPDRLSQESPPNLVVMLHGTGVEWGWAFWNYPIAAGEFRPDDVVVAPEGLTAGGGDTFNFVQGERDGDHLAGLIESFRARLPIGRVYLYGHSQGAFFSYWFAGAHPELVDGIVAHAGNVLRVQHTDASREGVAIGILHGKADAVVSVECAYRSEKIYRDEGYEHVKLYVVDGLTEKSGHWPLPLQVGEMLAWLDEVTEVSPDKAATRVLDEIRAEEPDLGAVVANLARAKQLAARTDPTDAAGFRIALGLAEAFVEECRAAHLAAIDAHADALRARKPEYGAWAASFRAAHAVFAGDQEWRKALGPIARTAASDEKRCTKAIAVLGSPSAKAVRAAAKVLESNVRGPAYDALRGELERFAESPPSGLKPKDRASLQELLASRRSVDDDGAAAAQRITSDVAKAFRERFPEVVQRAR